MACVRVQACRHRCWPAPSSSAPPSSVRRAAAQNETAGYYIYGVNAPTCAPGPDGEPLEQQPLPASTPSPLFDPCAWARVGAWFNRKDVQEALHAIQVRCGCLPATGCQRGRWAGSREALERSPTLGPPTLPCLQPGEDARRWKECDARALTYSLDSLLTSMVPVHEQLVKAGEAARHGGAPPPPLRTPRCRLRAPRCTPPHSPLPHPPPPASARPGLRALVFSGDSDGIVPTLSSRSWVETLGLPTAGELRPWVDTFTGQVGRRPDTAWQRVG